MVVHITHKGAYSTYGEIFFSQNGGFSQQCADQLQQRQFKKIKVELCIILSVDYAFDKLACSCKCH